MNSESVLITKQQDICDKYGAAFLAAPFNSFIAAALSTFDKPALPIHGLRHPVEREGHSSWYIWAGDYSDADDFFQNIHTGHLLDLYPKALNYLGLAEGWRFLIDDVYEDVWYDAELLNI